MHAFTFRLLEVFQRVVDSGSITAASQSLSLSQPTVSLQLKKLATQVGMPLIEQAQGKIYLTDAGRAVYQCAQEVLSSEAKLQSQISALQGVEVGSLKLAVVTTAKYVVPPLLSEFTKAHPKIDIQFTIENRADVVERLKHNRDDLYIFTQPPHDNDLQCFPFAVNKLQVVAPPDYDGPDHCHLRDLTGQHFLIRETGSGTRQAIDQYCTKHDVEFEHTTIIQSNEAIRLAVSTGMGLSIISEHTLANGPERNVKILSVADFPLLSHWQVVTNKHRPISLAASAFRDNLIERYKQSQS